MTELRIENCNNIDSGCILLKPCFVNIKYGMNGTGKSTLAKAIEKYIKGNNLNDLMPFKYLEYPVDQRPKPSVSGIDNIRTVAVFNEEYVNRFAFQKEDIAGNSFEIFIRTEEYVKQEIAIDAQISSVKLAFENNENIGHMLNDLIELSEGFGRSKDGYSKAGKIAKAIGNGNRIENIPEKLLQYSAFLKIEKNYEWIKWQMDGNKFFGISDDCPYCAVSTKGREAGIRAVSEEYDAKSIEHLNNLMKVVGRLGKYFNKTTNATVLSIVSNSKGPSEDQKFYLVEIKNQIDILIQKLRDLKGLSSFSFDEKDIKRHIQALGVEIQYLGHLDSEATRFVVDTINKSLETLAEDTGILTGRINRQRKEVKDTIDKYSSEINSFLKYAGFRYWVAIENQGQEFKLVLRYDLKSENIKNTVNHLSYGERNAFALVLFMYDSISRNPDLYILDDPISSFDKNKKYAIIDVLFKKSKSLNEKTVLLLTHDFEPVIDFVSTFRRKFKSFATFLRCNNGILSETVITKNDIVTFTRVCKENISTSSVKVIKLIYLRRYFEILDDKGMEYHVLSNVFKMKTPPDRMNSSGKVVLMSDEEIEKGSVRIRESVPGFNYLDDVEWLQDINNRINLYFQAGSDYEKLQVFRLLKDEMCHENSILMKFVNESYHIENEFIVQLNPSKYPTIPLYIIAECDNIVQNLLDEF